MKDTHTQCKLMKGNTYQITWLPSKYAIKGQYVRLRRKTGNPEMDDFPSPDSDTFSEWDDGWKVIEVWTTMSSDYVKERSRDYLKTRKASDI